METPGQGQLPTHSVSKPNKPAPVKPATEIEVFKNQLFTGYHKQVVNYFMGNKEKAQKFMSALVYSVQRTPELLSCDRTSLMVAAMAAAELELYPSNVSGEAYILPYKGKASFQLGYQGIITLVYRAGTSSIRSNIIYKNDVFDYEEGLNAKLVHKPDIFSKDKGEAVAAYAVAVLNGEKLFKVMTKDEIMKFKEFSKSKASEYSPWNSKNDPELHMWRKTVIKQLAKTLPKNDSLQKAIALDNQDSTISDRQNALDAGGAAVGRALHQPEDIDLTSPEVPPTGEESNGK